MALQQAERTTGLATLRYASCCQGIIEPSLADAEAAVLPQSIQYG